MSLVQREWNLEELIIKQGEDQEDRVMREIQSFL